MNNINTRWLSAFIILLLVANTITLSLLWLNKKDEPGNLRRQPRGQVFEFITRELKLNEQQQEAYSKLRDEHQAGVRSIKDSIRQAKDVFFSLLKEPQVPDSLIVAAAQKANAAEQQLDVFTFRHFQKVRAICNADQQKKFDSIIQEALHQMAPPPPMHGGNPPPEK
ncbi:periplasmic heavy metal sensor [Ferruginibacter lapsinanis]|uniref:Spy/CpxP family protein refolding chaperone n=1 Tax=Ferruginibacter lapsinanis TaxID=563172 RepID=UPI001E37CACF|nr:periplasmic heavy metal sensor [Ferruginibacter lapsinanis]UEG49423.1 periplasmic heavy metal sensor [Ferruginibacter lapsinanis]